MIKAIIFDCFGVFIGNPYKIRIQALDATDPQKAESLREINRASDRGFITREETAREMARIIGITQEELLAEQDKGEVRNDELVEYARTLRGDYKVAMLSNIGSRGRLDLRFGEGVLDELFDVVVPSGEVGFIKPEPEIYQVTIDKLGVLPEECVMIDDILEFCQGAEAVGMHAIQYFSNEQAIADLQALIDRGGERL